MIARLLGLLGALVLASCGASPAEDWGDPAPPLWEITGPDGEQGWLLGTIHALPDDVAWRTPALESALARSDLLLVEIADLSSANLATTFEALARTPGQPPLTARVAPDERAALAELMERADADDDDFANIETWAAALMLASAVRTSDTDNGVDRALIADADAVIGLETIAGQLGIFDGLSEADQSDMLALTAQTSAGDQSEAAARAWYAGDLNKLDTLVRRPMASTPRLEMALITARNRAWAVRIDELLSEGKRPLVAVGAGHMLGPDCLPALMTQRGYTVTRLR